MKRQPKVINLMRRPLHSGSLTPNGAGMSAAYEAIEQVDDYRYNAGDVVRHTFASGETRLFGYPIKA